MALQSEELFLKRFVEYNKERYQANPRFVAALDKLKADDIVFSNFRRSGDTVDTYTYLVDVDSPNLFEGDDQRYLPARFTEDGVAVLVEPEKLTAEELHLKATPGIYRLTSADNTTVGAVLVKRGQRNNVTVISLLQGNTLFEIDPSDIVIEDDLSSVNIDNTMIVSKLMVIESKYDDFPRFNGQYRANGSVRAL